MRPNPLDYGRMLERVVQRRTRLRRVKDSDEYQVAWVALLVAIESFDGRAPLEGWVYSKIQWAISDYRRWYWKRAREQSFEFEHGDDKHDEPESRESPPDTPLAYRELEGKVCRQMAKRTRFSYSIVRRYLAGQLTIGQIAESQQLSREAVYCRMRRARLGLRKQIEKWAV